MADSKITALTSISTSTDPANDPLVIVDVSDTSMAATGTTKKVTLNQLLGASGTATLASATITGDLTVDTNTLKVDSANNRVGIGTASPSHTLDVTSSATTVIRSFASAGNQAYVSVAGNGGVVGTSSFDLIQDGSSNAFIYNRANAYLAFGTNNSERYRIASDGVATWSNVGGVAGTAMTLNATGLGVGTTAAQKLTVLTNAGISAITATAADDRLIFTENMASANLGSQIVWKNSGNGNAYASIGFTNGAAGNNGSLIFSTSSSIFGSNNVERMRIKPNGQVRFIPLAADPAGAESGDVYYNSTSNKLKCYNGTTWNDLF